MKKPIVIVAAVLLLIAGAGGGLWLWERNRQPGGTGPTEQRLLIGFDAERVGRVRIRAGGETVDRKRSEGAWVPVPGRPDSGAAVRLPLVLRTLATLRVTEVRPAHRRGKRQALGEPVAEIDVWRGRARPLRLLFYRQGGKVLLRSSDRPGRYQVDAKVLRLLLREVRRARRDPVVAFAPDKLASLSLKRGARETSLVRRNDRWYVEDGGALAPADAAQVGRQVRALLQLRITHRLGQGAAAVRTHHLDASQVRITIDDGTPKRLAFGGACPKQPDARLVALGTGKKVEAVVCADALPAWVAQARFASNRLFNLTADEVRAASITRGRQTLALINRPGSGGWVMISPTERAVDQSAAARLVVNLTELSGTPVKQNQTMPPAGARTVGHLKVTPVTGSAQRVDLWAAGRGDRVRWARLAGGGRWIELPPTQDRFLSADPVQLRALQVCQADPTLVLAMTRSGLAGKTELLRRDGASWQLVLLQGRRSLAEARRIGVRLHEYQRRPRSAKAQTEPQWSKPVILATETDRAHRATLFHLATSLRARAFVAARSERAHGFGTAPLRLSYRYLHDCKDGRTVNHCQQSTCAVEIGGESPGGGCYARVPGDGAVFLAPKALCEAARRPLASRKVQDIALPRLSQIRLTAGRRSVTLQRTEAGGWRDPQDPKRPSQNLSLALLFLAPLRADRVESYGTARLGKPVLRARLEAPNQPRVRLTFYPGSGEQEEEAYLVVRAGLPVTFRVRAAPVKRLLQLVGKR